MLKRNHGVQINSDPRKILIWKKTLPWELFEARTATERFFTVDRCSKTIKYTYLVHRLFKSQGVQINTDPRKTLIWKKTLPWELLEMFENNTRTATERFSTHGRE